MDSRTFPSTLKSRLRDVFEFIYIVLSSMVLGAGLAVVIIFVVALIFPSVWNAWKPFVAHLLGA